MKNQGCKSALKQSTKDNINSIRQQLQNKFNLCSYKTPKNKHQNTIANILSQKLQKDNMKKYPNTKTKPNQLMKDKQNILAEPVQWSQQKTDQQHPIIQNIEQQKIIIDKKQLQKFTQSFAEQKLDLQQKIDEMNLMISDKNNKIEDLQIKLDQVRGDQHRMMDVMEHLKVRHEQEINNYELQFKHKQNAILQLQNQRLQAIKWIQKQQQENRRLLQIIKVKKQSQEYSTVKNHHHLKIIQLQSITIQPFINHMAAQNSQNRAQNDDNKFLLYDKNKRVHTDFGEQDKSPRKSKKIIIKKGTKQQHIKTHQFNSSVLNIQFQQKIRQLVRVTRDRDIQIQQLRKQNILLKSKLSHEIFESQEISFAQNQNERQIMLVNKCMFLERHIEKLMNKLINAENKKPTEIPQILVKLQNSHNVYETQFSQKQNILHPRLFNDDDQPYTLDKVTKSVVKEDNSFSNFF